MKDNDCVAVLLPTFKPGSYIEACLSSLDAQILDKSRFSVYIALNGPRDPYYQYVVDLLEFFEFRWSLFYLSRPGVSNARNVLLEKSTESYVCFVDDDDVLSENYIESLLKASDPHTIEISNVRQFSDRSEDVTLDYIGVSYQKLRDEEDSIFRSRKYFSSPVAKVIHRSIIGDSRFDVRVSRGEDALFMANLSPHVYKIRKGVPEAYYCVNKRVGSATRRKISRVQEAKRITYLLRCYSSMLLNP
ncbi:glycosyltransferase family 2 protein [Halomonas cibimaris]|uniref:glycosyltransferase n=1 Tax=Halomonas cibimaris TaxID=657012 RepID=UPI0031DCD029